MTTDNEAALSYVNNLLHSKEAGLASLMEPVKRRANTDRNGLPRELFRTMQRDLNRPLTVTEVRAARNTTHQEILELKARRLELSRAVEVERLAAPVPDVNGHTGEFINEASPAEVIIFSKRAG